MAAYRAEPWIDEALQSVFAQTRGDWEIVVVDDGSPDAVADRVRSYLADPRVRLIRQPNRGVSAARNLGARYATGRYLAVVDPDDRVHPEFLERVGAVLDSSPDVGLVGVDPVEFSDQTYAYLAQLYGGRPPLAAAGPGREVESLLGNTFEYHGAVMRAELFDRIGGYDLALSVLEDWDLWIRLAAERVRVVCLPEPLYEYRVRAGSAGRQTEDPLRTPHAALTVLAKSLDTLDLSRAERGAADRRWRIVTSHIADVERRRAVASGDHCAARTAAWRAALARPTAGRLAAATALTLPGPARRALARRG